MKFVFFTAVTMATLTLMGCQQKASPPADKTATASYKIEFKVDPELLKNPEMAKKIAEAKAKFEAMTPEERAKLSAGAETANAVLPLTLAEAASLPVTQIGGSPETLGKLAVPGTPTIIAAWASWCVPCKVEAKQLASLRQQYGKDKLNIVYLNIGNPKVEAAKGPQFLKEAGAESLGLTMLAGEDFKTLTKMPTISVPRVLPYDRTGKPKYPISGAMVTGDNNGKGDPRLVRAVQDITS